MQKVDVNIVDRLHLTSTGMLNRKTISKTRCKGKTIYLHKNIGKLSKTKLYFNRESAIFKNKKETEYCKGKAKNQKF